MSIRKTEIVTALGERLTMSDGSLWLHPFNGDAPVRERKPCFEQGHDWEANGCYSGGCVEYRCNACGATEDRDRS